MSCDESIVLEVQSGDKEAFNKLVLKYQDRLYKLIHGYIRDSDQVYDVVQDTLMKAYLALDSFKGNSTFYTWLYRIAVNTTQNYLIANKQAHKYLEIHIDDPDLFTDLSSKTHDNDTPEALLITEETSDAITVALEKLPAELRVVFLLREEKNLTYAEISKQLDWALGTVRSRLHRARQIILNEIKS